MSENLLEETSSEQLRLRNRELSILNTIAEALNRSIDLDTALNTVLAQVTSLLKLHTGWIWLLRENSYETYLAAAQNLPPGLVKNPKLMEGSCYCLDTYQAGDMDGAANVNVITCSRLKKLVDGSGGLQYHASIPLYAHGKQLGVLNVASRDWRQLSPEDLRLLYTVGDLLSIAVERARLFARSAEYGAIDERNRLAREIHDTIAQGLAGISLQLEAAEALLEAGNENQQVQTVIRQAQNLVRASLEETRRSVLDLRPAPLEGQSFPDALKMLAEQLTGENGVVITFKIQGDEKTLSSRIEAGLFRIAQEALGNAIQHANARHAVLQLIFIDNQVRLRVEDDGKGFDPSQIPPGRFGLVGINERVKLLRGEFNLDSIPGQGARLEVVIPLEGAG